MELKPYYDIVRILHSTVSSEVQNVFQYYKVLLFYKEHGKSTSGYKELYDTAVEKFLQDAPGQEEVIEYLKELAEELYKKENTLRK